MDWVSFAFGFCAVMAVALLVKYRAMKRKRRSDRREP